VDERLSTGLDALDRQLGGANAPGIPAGSLVLLEVPPGSQYEPILWAAMGERSTVYMVTIRTDASVRDDLAAVDPGPDHQVQDVGFETPVATAGSTVERVDYRANVVLDVLDPLERTDDRHRYVKFVTGLKRHLSATGGVGILVGTKPDSLPSGRQYTQSVADLVWELRSGVERTAVEHELFVRKFRGGDLPEETISLRLDREVSVDTSRDIA
jgi:KaiC/GvpD/RAD55 family RecA-like ATPase